MDTSFNENVNKNGREMFYFQQILARFSLVKSIFKPSHSKSLRSAIFFIKKEKLCLVTLSLELCFPIHKIVLSSNLKQNMKATFTKRLLAFKCVFPMEVFKS